MFAVLEPVSRACWTRAALLPGRRLVLSWGSL